MILILYTEMRQVVEKVCPETHMKHIVRAMTADDLAMEGARASAAKILA